MCLVVFISSIKFCLYFFFQQYISRIKGTCVCWTFTASFLFQVYFFFFYNAQIGVSLRFYTNPVFFFLDFQTGRVSISFISVLFVRKINKVGLFLCLVPLPLKKSEEWEKNWMKNKKLHTYLIYFSTDFYS